jgi:ethanolamine utilization protein EutN
MKIARVIGTMVCTVKNEPLSGKKILILKPMNLHGAPIGKAFVALDSIGAGVGEQVFYCGGKEASFPFLPAQVPADRTIVGILDRSNLHLGSFALARETDEETP